MFVPEKRSGYSSKNRYRQKAERCVMALSEAVILQAIEDLWINKCREECSAFFNGEGFMIYAEIAGISSLDQRRILKMVNSRILSEITA